MCNRHDCGRFKNCYSCRTDISEWEYKKVCKSCKPGFNLGEGNCKQGKKKKKKISNNIFVHLDSIKIIIFFFFLFCLFVRHKRM